MDKMLWEVKAPLWVGAVKEDIGLGNLYKYVRYFDMFLSRFTEKVNGVDYTWSIEYNLLWSGKVCLCMDKALTKLMVLKIDTEYKDANGNITKVDASGENGYKRKGLVVNQDCVIIYADSTRLPPIIYLWCIANQIIDIESIIVQQNNMLRKPILISGSGEAFDNAMNNLANVLSGVEFINTKSKKSKADNIMSDNEMVVLNLQTNNSYKGAELWQSHAHYEDFIRDYLGYPSVNNEKRERMITDEVNQTQAFAKANYDSSVYNREQGFKMAKEVLGVDIEFNKVLKWEEQKEEVTENDRKEDVE